MFRCALPLILLLLFSANIHVAQSAEKSNVLFIAVDDLRPELGCYGAKHIHSPNIDALAKQGLLFNRAYCQQAVCSPSRTSLMTGARPDTTKVWDLTTDFRDTYPNVVTLTQHFIANKYTAVGMGKIYHSGFNDKLSWSGKWKSARGQAYANPDNMKILKARRKKAIAEGLKGIKLSRASRGPAFESADVADNVYTDGAVAEQAIKTLGELKKKKSPFFLAVGFIKPHLPFVAPKKYWDLYDRKTVELAKNRFHPKDAPKYANTSWGEMRVYSGIPKKGDLPLDDQITLRHGYYACVSYVDALVGKLVKELETLKLRKNTIIILWGDHGWKLGEHNGWCKHTNFEDDARVPLIISVPGQKSAGQKTDALVEFVDIYPSLAQLAGLELPKHLEGTSFVPLIENPKRKWKTAAFSQYPRGYKGKKLMGYSMKTDRYRFTRWDIQKSKTKSNKKVDSYELYDHKVDPDENRNIANLPENKKLIEELSAQLDDGWKAARPN